MLPANWENWDEEDGYERIVDTSVDFNVSNAVQNVPHNSAIYLYTTRLNENIVIVGLNFFPISHLFQSEFSTLEPVPAASSSPCGTSSLMATVFDGEGLKDLIIVMYKVG